MRTARPQALWLAALFISGLAGLFHTGASAQQRDELVAALVLPTMPMHQRPAPPAPPPVRISSMFPGITLISPNAYAADGWTIFAGAGFQERTRFTNDSDGAAWVGVGLGDAHKYVGLELTAASFSTVNSGFFDRVGFSALLHRQIGSNTAIGIGAENFEIINGDESDTDWGAFGVASHIFVLRKDPRKPFSMMTATIGVGNGRFRFEDDIFDDDENVNVFGAVSIHPIRPVAIIADWYGQDLAVGLSLAPFPNFPIVVVPAVADITNNAGDGARFIIGATVGYRLSKGAIQF
jgi:hypothetical protein